MGSTHKLVNALLILQLGDRQKVGNGTRGRCAQTRDRLLGGGRGDADQVEELCPVSEEVGVIGKYLLFQLIDRVAAKEVAPTSGWPAL